MRCEACAASESIPYSRVKCNNTAQHNVVHVFLWPLEPTATGQLFARIQNERGGTFQTPRKENKRCRRTLPFCFRSLSPLRALPSAQSAAFDTAIVVVRCFRSHRNLLKPSGPISTRLGALSTRTITTTPHHPARGAAIRPILIRPVLRWPMPAPRTSPLQCEPKLLERTRRVGRTLTRCRPQGW